MGTRNTSLYGIALSAVCALLLASQGAQAQPKKKSAPAPQAADDSGSATSGAQKKDDKVDISDLENKYWAPKDTDFSVVQNRTYTKEHRWFLSGLIGSPVNDQWSVGNTGGAAINYFWSERMGVQATWLKSSLNNNKAADFIANNYGTFGHIYADHNRLDTYYGLSYNLVPFYAKMSFWGKKIIYFDMAISPSLGWTTYDQQISTGNRTKGAFTYGIDITQYFFFSNHFAIRADLKNQWHNEEIARYYDSGGIATGAKVKDDTAQDTIFLFGVTFFY